jgi:hypothetical protein
MCVTHGFLLQQNLIRWVQFTREIVTGFGTGPRIRFILWDPNS